jgi:hypothetical protein
VLYLSRISRHAHLRQLLDSLEKIEKMDFLGYIYPIQELDARKELLLSVVFLRLFIPEDLQSTLTNAISALLVSLSS